MQTILRGFAIHICDNIRHASFLAVRRAANCYSPFTLRCYFVPEEGGGGDGEIL